MFSGLLQELVLEGSAVPARKAAQPFNPAWYEGTMHRGCGGAQASELIVSFELGSPLDGAALGRRPDLARNEVHVVASAGISLATAKRRALELAAHVLSDAIEGKAPDAGKVLAGTARSAVRNPSRAIIYIARRR